MSGWRKARVEDGRGFDDILGYQRFMLDEFYQSG